MPTPVGKHIPALDGLRGIAILLVLATHSLPHFETGSRALEWCRKLAESGWIGVDLFFVLSGFLITRILLAARSDPHYYRNFFARRFLRIVPLYYGFLAVLLIILPIAGVQDRGIDVLTHVQAWLWTFTSNVLMALRQSWTLATPSINVAHFWSVAVEEQFYLLWPFIVCRSSHVTLVRICLVGIALAIVSRILCVTLGAASLTAYILLPCRMDSLLFGSMLGVLVTWRPQSLVRVRTYVTLAGIACAMGLAAILYVKKGLWFEHWSMQIPGYSMLAVTFGAAMLCVLEGDGFASQTMRIAASLGPLRIFGKYSYSMYLFHVLVRDSLAIWLPMEAVCRFISYRPAAALAIFFVNVTATLLFAMATWHLYEKWFLLQKRRFAFVPQTAGQLVSSPAAFNAALYPEATEVGSASPAAVSGQST